MQQITQSAMRSKARSEPTSSKKKSVSSAQLEEISKVVQEYFKDSKAVLVTSREQLHDYITDVIGTGECAIDTETTGLDLQRDTIVGTSIYHPNGVEIYIPCKHILPIFETLYPGQLTYEDVGAEYQRLVDAKVLTDWANADFDLAMLFKDFGVDFMPVMYWDVIAAWRTLKENEPDKALKVLYNKYVLKGHGNPKKFSDFFSPTLFPYCRPEIAGLYAANDSKITYELKEWQMPYVTKSNPKCIKAGLQAVSDLVWNVEMPMISVCQTLHRNGMYIDQDMAKILQKRYGDALNAEYDKMYKLLDEVLSNPQYVASKPKPFSETREFNPNSTPHVKWLCYDFLHFEAGKKASTDKDVLRTFNHPLINQILKIRSFITLISTFVEKIPNSVGSDGRIHCDFLSCGADTGRMSSRNPNLQNIPSHNKDIRRMFRAKSGYVLLSSDYSQQEPKLTAYISQDENMIRSFQENKDIYSFIASIAFNKSYEDCLENRPTGEFDEEGNPIYVYQPDGKARRGEAKSVVLGEPMSYAPLSEISHYRPMVKNLVNHIAYGCTA